MPALTASDTRRLRADLEAIVGPGAVVTDPSELLVYESDGLTVFRASADAIVFPTSTEQVAACVKLANAEGLPFVARGAGTGLAGGCLPAEGGVVIALTRMTRILEVDYDNQLAVVEPGLVNLHLSQALAPRGYYYAPDPSSQIACTIGGNVANNSGGPHTLKYGVTTNHVLGLEVVLPDGEVMWLGGKTRDPQGYDLVGRVRRLRGHLRHRHQDRRPHPAAAAGGEDAAGRLRPAGPGVGHRGGDHRAGADAGRAGDDRPHHHPGRRGRLRGRLPARRRRRSCSSSWTASRSGSTRRPSGWSRPAGRTAPATSAWPGTRPSGCSSGRGGSRPSAPTGGSRPPTS